VQLLTGGRGALGFTGALRRVSTDRDPPTAKPADITREIQVDRRINTTAVKGCQATASLEFPKCNLGIFITAAAGCERTVDESNGLTCYK